MSGPVLVIELAEVVPRASIQRVREFLVRSAARFEEKRVGEYDVSIHAESLGIMDTGDVDGRRPVLVSLMGPGIGNEAVFEAEHADEVDQESLIGFAPTHAVDVIAFCNSQPIVAGLPGIVAAPTDPWPAAYGSAEFLRAWARQPGFRLLK
ncbi:DUF6368 family protein [Streptomyces sp. NBC_01381]|uniref:DUF6368 family protein n=1 Tax=Streptomyces sp. NBC_01381 TaxID=2903845 RepID=UPI0022528A67|nr:DUF6368 family protein [Streptomyces sp. NBC_01381]MCX4671986.1 DUF6368 family protein [Streptomyces sp. NBC_01381]